MAIYVMSGSYTPQAMKGISGARTKKATSLIKKLGGKILSIYALLGDTDLLIIADLPNNKKAMKASAALNKLTGISFKTSPAISVKEFDKLMGK